MSSSCFRKLDNHKCWGWLVVTSVFMSLFISMGVARVGGVFYKEWTDYFESTSSVTSTLSMLTTSVPAVCGLVANTIVARFSFRPVIIAGGLITSAGLLSSAFVPEIYFLFGTYGCIVGLGSALGITPLWTVAVYYFPERPGLATSITISGICLGGTIVPILVEVLIDVYHWKGAFIVLSALSLNTCVCGALLRPRASEGGEGEEQQSADLKSSIKKIFSSKNFILSLASCLLMSMGAQIVFAHVKVAILELTDVSDTSATYGLSLVSGGNFVAALVLGVIFHCSRRLESRVVPIFIALQTLLFYAIFLFPQVPVYPILMTYCTIIGFGLTASTALAPLIVREFVGEENTTFAFGFYAVSYGLGAIFGPLVAGFTYDHTGDYRNSFYISGACIFGSNLFLFYPCIFNSLKKKNDVQVTCSFDSGSVAASNHGNNINKASSGDILPHADEQGIVNPALDAEEIDISF